MKYPVLFLSMATFCLLNFTLYAVDEIKDSATQQSFPKEITFEQGGKNYKLEITGIATRKKFLIKLYSVAHYLEDAQALAKGVDIFEEILQDNKAKQLTIKWVHKVEANKIQNSFKDSFKKSAGDTGYDTKFEKEINQFLSFFKHEINKGDVHILRWLPGGKIIVLDNDKQVGTIVNQSFAKALWNIWFGPNSVVDRQNLISQLGH